MKIIVVGAGRIGESIVKYLSEEGHDIVVIDVVNDKVEEVVNRYDVMGICGNGSIGSNLKEAGVEKADLLIAVTSKDEQNVLCCLVAKIMGVKNTIARVRDPEYNDQFEFMREQLGINMLFNPEEEAALEIFRLLRFPSALKVESFSGGKIDLVEIKIGTDSQLQDVRIADIPVKYKVKVLICAVERDNEVLIPDGNFVLRVGDVINITSTPSEMEVFFKKLGIFKHKVQSVMIIGGGKIGYYLARELEESGHNVKIIEKSYERCVELKSMLKKVAIICDEGTDRNALEEEGLTYVDACVALMDNDERNIVLSLYAKSKMLSKVVTKVNNETFEGILKNIELDSIVSPKQVMASQIVSYVRAMDAPNDSRVVSLYKIVNGRAEALEFKVNDNKLFVGKSLRDITLKKNILFAGIVRGSKTVIPDGNTIVEGRDRIIVVTTNPQLSALEDILE